MSSRSEVCKSREIEADARSFLGFGNTLPQNLKEARLKPWTWRTTSKSEFIKCATVGSWWERHRISYKQHQIQIKTPCFSKLFIQTSPTAKENTASHQESEGLALSSLIEEWRSSYLLTLTLNFHGCFVVYATIHMCLEYKINFFTNLQVSGPSRKTLYTYHTYSLSPLPPGVHFWDKFEEEGEGIPRKSGKYVWLLRLTLLTRTPMSGATSTFE